MEICLSRSSYIQVGHFFQLVQIEAIRTIVIHSLLGFENLELSHTLFHLISMHAFVGVEL